MAYLFGSSKLLASSALLLACFARLAAGSSSLDSVIKGLTGETKVDCQAVCDAAGHPYGGWAYSMSGVASEWTCKCHGGWVRINCQFSSFEPRFEKCCEAGKSCQPDEEPNIEEEDIQDAEEEDAREAEDPEDLEVDDGVAVSHKGVPNCPPCPGTLYQLTQAEIAKALTIHNKMRKAVGTPALHWNCHLMCQAQQHADKCKFEHSGSYNSPIKAGENIATGSDGELAAWMWFSEYGAADKNSHADFGCCGHFTAMVWKSSKHLGCGTCKDSVYVCQYAASPANFGGPNALVANVPKFTGTAAQYKKAGLDPSKAEMMFQRFASWGLNIGDVFERFYATKSTPSLPLFLPHSSSTVFRASAAAALTSSISLLLVLRWRRQKSQQGGGDEEQVRSLTAE